MVAGRGRIPFDEVDPFNPDARVRGYLIRSKRRRGDLLITHVNGEPCEQRVFGAPRIAHLEPDTTVEPHQRVAVYEKIDGTNVLLFRYRDAGGRAFVSYKTRLSPFLRNQAYGDLVGLWREILTRYASEIASLVPARYAFAFELFGHRLRILTSYDVPLDARLLYALDPSTGSIVDPEAEPGWTFPRPPRWLSSSASTPPAEVHREVHERLERASAELELEGAVVYFLSGLRAQVFKVKPPAVREAQARYRELYGHAKSIARDPGDPHAVLDGLDVYVKQRWTPEARAAHRKVLGIAREDIDKELRFDAARAPEAPDERAQAVLSQRLLWETVWGSHLWGMETEMSDRDRCFVYQLDHRTVVLGAFDPPRLRPFRTGWKRRSAEGDEHWYELGHVVQQLLSGSVTMLYGVMSPHVTTHDAGPHAELRALLEAHPSRVFYRGVVDVLKDTRKLMRRARSRPFFLKQLRIGCRNLRFAITLFSEARYVFEPSHASSPEALDALQAELQAAYEASSLPVAPDPRPFEDYVLRWRRHRERLDERSTGTVGEGMTHPEHR